MTIIDQISNQMSSFAEGISATSTGAFVGRVVTFVINHPVILVAVAAILVVGACIYTYSKKLNKLDELVSAYKLELVDISQCPVFYESDDLKKIQLPLLPKGNYYVKSYKGDDQDYNKIYKDSSFLSFIKEQIDENLPLAVLYLEEIGSYQPPLRKSVSDYSSQFVMDRGIGMRCEHISIVVCNDKIDLEKGLNKSSFKSLCSHLLWQKAEAIRNVMSDRVISEMAESLK